MKAFLFPGQGSQKEGMGKDLYEQFPKAKGLYRYCPWIAHTNLLAKYHRATVHYSK